MDVTLRWTSLTEPFLVEYLKEQSATGAHEMFSLFVPASGAEVIANGVRGQGRPRPARRVRTAKQYGVPRVLGDVAESLTAGRFQVRVQPGDARRWMRIGLSPS